MGYNTMDGRIYAQKTANAKREDHEDVCKDPIYNIEHEDMIRQERVASFMGECVRERLGMSNVKHDLRGQGGEL